MGIIKPGVYEKVSFEDYLSWPCFHKSMVASALRSTKHLEHYIESEKKASKVMDFGSLVDCMLLEPDIFSTHFTERPETYPDSKTGVQRKWNNNAGFCKEWNENARVQNLTIYSKDDYDKALKMVKNCSEHRTASEWLKDAKTQVAIVWEDPDTGILCKARIDILKKDRMVDLKTTSNASCYEFNRTINSMLYHVQAAIYTEGWSVLHDGELLKWNFIVIESDAPHCVATYELNSESILIGNHLFKKAIRKYKDYLASGPTGYSDFVEEIEIPQWAMNLVEENIDV